MRILQARGQKAGRSEFSPARDERIVQGRAECPIWECVPRTSPSRCRRTSRSRSYDRGGTCYPRGALNRSTSCLSRERSRVDRRVGHRSSYRAGKLVVVAGIQTLASAERAVRDLAETLATTIGGRKRVRRRVDTSEKRFEREVKRSRRLAVARARANRRVTVDQTRQKERALRFALSRFPTMHDTVLSDSSARKRSGGLKLETERRFEREPEVGLMIVTHRRARTLSRARDERVVPARGEGRVEAQGRGFRCWGREEEEEEEG